MYQTFVSFLPVIGYDADTGGEISVTDLALSVHEQLRQ